MPSICVFCKLDMKSRLESNSFSQNFGNIWAYLDLRALWRSLNLPKWLNLWHGGWVFWVLGEGLCCQPTSHLFFFFFLSLPIVVQFKRFPTLIIGVIKKKNSNSSWNRGFRFPLDLRTFCLCTEDILVQVTRSSVLWSYGLLSLSERAAGYCSISS